MDGRDGAASVLAGDNEAQCRVRADGSQDWSRESTDIFLILTHVLAEVDEPARVYHRLNRERTAMKLGRGLLREHDACRLGLRNVTCPVEQKPYRRRVIDPEHVRLRRNEPPPGRELLARLG